MIPRGREAIACLAARYAHSVVRAGSRLSRHMGFVGEHVPCVDATVCLYQLLA